MWDYKIITQNKCEYDSLTDNQFNDKCSELGKWGWEMISLGYNDGGYFAAFKKTSIKDKF